MKIITNLGRALKNDRESRDIKQAQLARAINVPATSVHRWENEGALPRGHRLQALIDYFGENSETAAAASDLMKRSPAGKPKAKPRKTHTRRFEASERHFRKNLQGDIAFDTDFYFSTDGYLIIEQEVDDMRVALTPQQLEDFLAMVHENDLVNEAYMARYGPKERKICTSKEAS